MSPRVSWATTALMAFVVAGSSAKSTWRRSVPNAVRRSSSTRAVGASPVRSKTWLLTASWDTRASAAVWLCSPATSAGVHAGKRSSCPTEAAVGPADPA